MTIGYVLLGVKALSPGAYLGGLGVFVLSGSREPSTARFERPRTRREVNGDENEYLRLTLSIIKY